MFGWSPWWRAMVVPVLLPTVFVGVTVAAVNVTGRRGDAVKTTAWWVK